MIKKKTKTEKLQTFENLGAANVLHQKYILQYHTKSV